MIHFLCLFNHHSDSLGHSTGSKVNSVSYSVHLIKKDFKSHLQIYRKGLIADHV